MNRSELINRVKTKIDEITPTDGLIVNVGIADEKPIDDVIDSLLNESAREILLKAPIHRLPVTSSNNTPTAGFVQLPSNFLRLVEFKMQSWRRAVVTPYLSGSPEAEMMSFKWRTGTADRPAVVLSHRGSNLGLEVYPFISGNTVERFLYIKEDVAENIPDNLVDSLCWVCASKVLSVFGRDGKVAIDYAISLLQ